MPFRMNNMESKKYQLNRQDGKKIVKGIGIAIGGAAVLYLAEVIPNVEFGIYAPLVAALAGVLVNAARKWLASNK